MKYADPEEPERWMRIRLHDVGEGDTMRWELRGGAGRFESEKGRGSTFVLEMTSRLVESEKSADSQEPATSG